MDPTFDRIDGADDDQLRRMQALAGRLWSWASRWHPGELASFWCEAGGPASSWDVATWRIDHAVVAWGWSRGAGALDLQVDPAHLDLLDDVLAWCERLEGRSRPVVTVLDAEREVVEALQPRGWTVDRSGPFFAHLRLDLDRLPPRSATVRTHPVRGERDVALRSALHRAAFGTGEPTTPTYHRLMRCDGYLSALDVLAESADGTAAAFALSWLDVPSSVAVLEPVGADPGHRREGLAQAAVLASLHAAAERGARHARVCARADEPGPALALYESVGFERYARNVRLVPPHEA